MYMYTNILYTVYVVKVHNTYPRPSHPLCTRQPSVHNHILFIAAELDFTNQSDPNSMA